MATAQQRAATTADYEEYQTVVDIVNKGFAKNLTEILQQLRDPDSFDKHIRGEAEAQGLPLDAAADTMSWYNSFWNNCTGCFPRFDWLSDAGYPERAQSTAVEIAPDPDPSPVDGARDRWGFSLPLGISFYT